jgi:hypothetical protein
MQDFMNLVMLVCATLASMGLGVFASYGIFKAGFAAMRWHTQLQMPVKAEARAQVARVL